MILAEYRAEVKGAAEEAILAAAAARLAQEMELRQRRVFNLTGTVLHTNLGRALLPEEAIAATIVAMREPTTLEYDLARGARGERDAPIERWLQRLTGAEAATVVNNNAAALLLVLHALALEREVVVSRGELIEIGGSFRLPELMTSAGCRLKEVGTTNRTHLRDYAEAIGEKTALLLKVHTSNYEIKGFTAAVETRELAGLARERGLILVEDLGSGALIDLKPYGLVPEPGVTEVLAAGADLVTFSGDKLLGGPQGGMIVGRADLVQRLSKHPMKRALRLDKLRLAALEAVLRLYADPDRLPHRLPVLRLLLRPVSELEALGARLLAPLAPYAKVSVIASESQVGSGARPLDLLESRALALASERGAEALAASFRALPIPVIGRISEDRLVLDLRCLEDEAAFVAQLPGLDRAR